MILNSEKVEQEMVMQTAAAMCGAARTAPKTKGIDAITTKVVYGKELEILAEKMESYGLENDLGFFSRDAKCVKKCDALVLIGMKTEVRGLDPCGYCGFSNCNACLEAGGRCALVVTDLGIAVGSAVSVAADWRVDNRVFFSAGVGAMALNWFKEDIQLCYGIPLAVNGKNIFFDR